MTETPRTSRTWPWQPVLLLLLFLGPLVAAVALYYGSDRWRPAGATNHGILIQPPVVLPQLQAAPDQAGQAAGDLRGRWTLVYVDAGSCGARCVEALYRGGQVRTALGRYMGRLERLYVHMGPAPSAESLGKTDGLRVVGGTGADARLLLAALPADLVPGEDLLLVDPLGNLMMRFPLDDDAKGMLTDLKKLMKLSRIG